MFYSLECNRNRIHSVKSKCKLHSEGKKKKKTSRITATCDLGVIVTAGMPSQYDPSQIIDLMPQMLIGSIQSTISLSSSTFRLNHCITEEYFPICSTVALHSPICTDRPWGLMSHELPFHWINKVLVLLQFGPKNNLWRSQKYNGDSFCVAISDASDSTPKFNLSAFHYEFLQQPPWFAAPKD